MRLDELTGRRVALLGLGADVRAALPAVRAAGPAELVVVEEGADPGPVDAIDGSALRSLADAAAGADVFVRSPGFPRYQPPLLAALDRGARMTTPLDLWLGTFGAGRTVIAITGTKGKSTVTDLLGSLARGAGLRAGVAGNLGVPVFSAGWDHDAPLIVLEVSSYQAADLHHVPDVAVLTFLAEDHLSWHGGVEPYVADKLRVLANEAGRAGRILVPAEGGRAAEVAAAAGLSVEVVAAPVAGADVPAHRVQNAALAAAALAASGGPQLDDAAIVDAARSSLPGRLDPCPGPAGTQCLDDALASNPSATAAALRWLRGLGRPTVVVLGGADRGVDMTPLAAEAAQWPAGSLRAVTLPDNGAVVAARCGIVVVDVADGVADAVPLALAALRSDGVLLFSPAAPTRPGEGNWETRSKAFRAACAGLVS
ncbi:MAG: UDP-N-acetylmuramoylalanine--D-glutamate ligase [Acidimicrobiales bacterium]|nr:UDP-N-acetylmuramoylalanine--D-glutamate ligase [Acidimicrobiales bacterium]